VIVISGHGNIDTAVRATRLGAYDFLEKPLSLERVILTINHALSDSKLREQVRDLRREVFEELLVGESDVMRARESGRAHRAGALRPSQGRIHRRDR
jgi:two-component system nitrogen regulation response regulator NtrX